MSSEAEEAAVAAGLMCCASCGKAEVDDVKLKKCACKLVKYCSVDCQKNHRPQHKKICRKGLAELRDDDLFSQPDGSHHGDCSICCLPLPIDPTKSIIMSCCSKYICNGCCRANQNREIEAGLEHRCAFCREPMPESEEEFDKRLMARIKKNCPVAMTHMAKKRRDERDYETAFEYFTKAAELGDTAAHYSLSRMYYQGEGREKDIEKYIYHLEEAAMKGHPMARHNLGVREWRNGRFERAKKHFIIAANLGHDDSLYNLRQFYANGIASKKDYSDALRAYQAAVDATKSPEREEAEAYYEAMDAAQRS
jgi:tetratricopeptide (TPR) repeat protein